MRPAYESNSSEHYQPRTARAGGGTLQELNAGGCRLSETVAGAVRPGNAFVIDQGFDVDGPLDLLTSIPVALVARQLLCAVQDANPVFVGQQAQGAAHVGVRHRVVVQIEAQRATKGLGVR